MTHKFVTVLDQRISPSAVGTILLAPLLVACAAPIPSPTPTFTPAPTATPALVAPTSENWPEAVYVLESETSINGYTVRIWKDTKQEEFQFARIATISSPGQETVQIEFFDALGELTGSDITGEGNADLIIETYSGGAHCCFSTKVFDLGTTISKVLDSPESNCGGTFDDLDGDGILEFVTCDDIFAYAYCPYASSPFAPVVLQYQIGAGYLPATPHFADLYAEDIANHRKLVETAESFGEWDETNKCSLLPLVLDYLYTGQPEKAWEALDRYYPFEDKETFRQEIEDTVNNSMLFTASLNPTGWIVYESALFGAPNIFILRTEGSEATQLTKNSIDALPSWSPDGKWIAFASMPKLDLKFL